MPALYALAVRRLLPRALRDRRRRAHRRHRRRLLPQGHGDRGEAARARPVPSGDLGRARPDAPLRLDRLRRRGRRGQAARPARAARREGAARRQPRLLPRRPAAGLPDDRRGARQATRRRGLDAAGRREAVRPRPRVGEAAHRDAAASTSTRTRSSGSTTTSARRRCRTCSPFASRTGSSSRSGTASSSTTSRSPSPSRSGSRRGPATTSTPARSATSSRTTSSSCSR